MKFLKPLPNYWLNSSSGFGLVEVLAASALISIGALGLGTSMYQLANSRVKSQSTSTMVAAESAISLAVVDPGSYSDQSAYYTAISSNQTPNINVAVNIYNTISATPAVVQLPVSATAMSYLDIYGRPCNGFGDSAKACIFSINLSFKYQSGTPYFVYTISADNNVVANVIPIAGQVEAPSNTTSSQNDCLSQGKLAANGISNKQLACISPPQSSCAAGTYPTAITYNSSSGGPGSFGSFEFTCSASPAQGAFCCPPNYVLQKFLVGDLLDSSKQSSAPNEMCVHAAVNQQAFPTNSAPKTYGPAKSISGLACPVGYVLSTACKVSTGAASCLIDNSTPRSLNCQVSSAASCSSAAITATITCVAKSDTLPAKYASDGNCSSLYTVCGSSSSYSAPASDYASCTGNY